MRSPLDGLTAGTVTITSLAQGSSLAPGIVKRVRLAGVATPLKFVRDTSGLTITVPADGTPATMPMALS